MTGELVVLLLFAVVGWFWFDSLRSREIAVAAARDFCAQKDLQFLDGAVVSLSVRPIRIDGGITLARRFRFEFSDTGNNRLAGNIFMHGNDVVSMHVEAFDSGAD